jgi:ATP-binding cassette subfamily C exporter for protease/lipase
MKNRLLNAKSEIEQALIGFKSTFFTIGIFSAISNLLMLVPSIYMLQVYDRVLASRNEITLLMLTLMMLGAYLLMSGLELIRVHRGFRAKPEKGRRQCRAGLA